MSIIWRDLPPLPRAVGGQFVGTLDDRLIVAGGTFWQGGEKIWTDQIFALSSDATDWNEVGRLPELLAYGSTVSVMSGMICLGGQRPDGGASAYCYRLRWNDGRAVSSRLMDLPEPLMMMGAAATRDAIYLAGGLNKGALAGFWSIPISEFEAGCGTWTALHTWPGAPRFFPQMAAGADAVYLAGGTDLVTGSPPVRRFLQDAFAWLEEQWIVLPDLPAPAQAGLAAIVDCEYFVFGGNDGSLVDRETDLKERHPGFRTSIWKLSRGEWSEAGQLPGSFVTTGIAEWKGELVIAGGEDRPGHRTARVIAGRPNRRKHL